MRDQRPLAAREQCGKLPKSTVKGDNKMSSTAVTVRRDEEGNVVAHWVGSVTFHPSVYGDPDSFRSLINECVENFSRELESEISLDFKR
jgi:hypothetical protein